MDSMLSEELKSIVFFMGWTHPLYCDVTNWHDMGDGQWLKPIHSTVFSSQKMSFFLDLLDSDNISFY